MADNATREMHEAVDKVIAEKKKEPIGTKEAEQEVAADLNEAAHRDTQGVRHTQEAKKTMQAKHPNRDGSKAPRSRKGVADEAKADHDRQRQHDHDRSDRGNPQDQKDKDFQRKF